MVDYWRVERQASSLAGQPLMLRVLLQRHAALQANGQSGGLVGQFEINLRPRRALKRKNTACNCCTVGNIKGV